MRFARSILFFACLMLCFVAELHADEHEADAPGTGIFTAHFSERSPLSDPGLMAQITRWPQERMPAYDPADHVFQLVVPKDYDGSEAYGVLVFIHPKNNISIERFYGRSIQELLAQHKLIWVSYSDAGNPVMPNIRLGLALDAVHNVQKKYRIDQRRVYVSGISGGGRMTCVAGIYYPQVFTGMLPMAGTTYFRDVKLPEDPELRALIKPAPPEGATVWPRHLFEPSARRLKEMTQKQHWVLLAGETDYNMPQMRAHYEQGFKRDGFKHAHYLEVPGMGHVYPDAKWYGKALALLDKPLNEDPAAGLEPADERTQRIAQRRLEVALRTLERDRERGVRVLERLIDELPNTEAARSARAKLNELSTQ